MYGNFVHATNDASQYTKPLTSFSLTYYQQHLIITLQQLRILLQLHFGAVADRFVLLQQVAQQKSATKVYVCHQGYNSSAALWCVVVCFL